MFKSLTSKVLTLIIVLIALCSISLIGVSYYEIYQSTTQQMKNDGTALIKIIKTELLKANIQDLNQLHEEFKGTASVSEGNLEYISLSDENGTILVSDDILIEAGIGGDGCVVLCNLTRGCEGRFTYTANHGTDNHYIRWGPGI